MHNFSIPHNRVISSLNLTHCMKHLSAISQCLPLRAVLSILRGTSRPERSIVALRSLRLAGSSVREAHARTTGARMAIRPNFPSRSLMLSLYTATQSMQKIHRLHFRSSCLQNPSRMLRSQRVLESPQRKKMRSWSGRALCNEIHENFLTFSQLCQH